MGFETTAGIDRIPKGSFLFYKTASLWTSILQVRKQRHKEFW